ncbi:hypothetical protein [Lactiplantibacillus mudanjiangensis]|uniref:Uncharacterized protein n=1 Tax=Lactiplantibacillus mudanjiangensis TaxID=1296538 RepID=A0A660E1U1_9LACO|nr:hypothetical protein [Lactiplantibacillus mudanjiangensis]VDG23713.1 hypothetical protein MUDAN_IGPPGNFN_02251 [Lactiplantibacillus mudanjiangensis]VDG29614.1 hypothetical protein MUDAN_MDHGFNIF_03528 [Lactiplantibacillus mudanjiangensis]
MLTMQLGKCDEISEILLKTMIDNNLTIGEIEVVADNLPQYVKRQVGRLKPRSEELFNSTIK